MRDDRKWKRSSRGPISKRAFYVVMETKRVASGRNKSEGVRARLVSTKNIFHWKIRNFIYIFFSQNILKFFENIFHHFSFFFVRPIHLIIFFILFHHNFFSPKNSKIHPKCRENWTHDHVRYNGNDATWFKLFVLVFLKYERLYIHNSFYFRVLKTRYLNFWNFRWGLRF